MNNFAHKKVSQDNFETNKPSPRFKPGPILLLTVIFFLNFLSRIVLAPLLITIEKDYHLGHGEAGSFFLLISIGYSVSLLCSGFISARFSHKNTIIFSAMAVGASVLAVAFNQSLWGTKIALLMVGLSAGLYLPSAFATITTLVQPKDWGKGLAIHELAPSLSFVAAPLLAEAFLGWLTWRWLLALLGLASMLMGLAFYSLGKGGDFRGEAPSLNNLGIFITEPAFWIMVVQFILAIGASLGVYTMIPLYLVEERGMSQGMANTFIALSKVSGLFVTLMAGWIIDRLGSKNAMVSFLLITGIFTVLLGVIPGAEVVPVIFFQQTLVGCFFPAGFAVLSRIGPAKARNMVVSLTMPLAFLIGGGAIPTGIGILAELSSFSAGMIFVGMLVLTGLTLTRFLKFSDEGKEIKPGEAALN